MMTLPPLTAESSLHNGRQTDRAALSSGKSSGAGHDPAAVIPAIYIKWERSFTGKDGSTGWCITSCDMNGCVYGWD